MMIGITNGISAGSLVNSGGLSDLVAPAISSITTAVNGLSVDVVFAESLDNGVTLDLADFTFDCPSASPPTKSSASHVTTTNANDTVRIVFSTPWYQPEGTGITVDVAAGAVEDLAGNPNGATTNSAVTNNSTVWPVSSAGAAYSPEGGTIAAFKADQSGNGNDLVSDGADPGIDLATYGAAAITFNGSTQYLLLPTAFCSAVTGGSADDFTLIAGIRPNGASPDTLFYAGATSSNYGCQMYQAGTASCMSTRRRGGSITTVTSTAVHPNATWTTVGSYSDGTTGVMTEGDDSTTTTASGSLAAGSVTSSSVGYLGKSRTAGQEWTGECGRVVIDAVYCTGRDRAVLQTWVDEYTAGM